VLNMFRTLIFPSSGACDYTVELPHWLYCCWFDVCWSFGVVGLGWYPCSRLQQHSRKLLMMGVLMSETCWAYKKWNKIASDIKFGLLFFNKICVRVVPCGRTDMTKPIVTFRNFANAPNNSYKPSVIQILCSCNTFVCAADSSCLFTVTGLWHWVANWYKCCNWRVFN